MTKAASVDLSHNKFRMLQMLGRFQSLFITGGKELFVKSFASVFQIAQSVESDEVER